MPGTRQRPGRNHHTWDVETAALNFRSTVLSAGEYLATRDEVEEAAAAAAAAGERCCIFELVPQRVRLAAGRYGTAAAGIDARKVGNAAK